MTSVRIDQGLADLKAHFETRGNHTEGDPEHVSQQELRQATGRVSADADAVIETLRTNGSYYSQLKGLYKEGYVFQDSQLSMQDLTAAVTGRGKKGASVASQSRSIVTNMQRAVEAAAAKQAAFERAVAEVVNNGTGVFSNHTHTATLRMGRSDFTLDFEQHLKNAAQATTKTIVIDGDTYNSWRQGQTLSRKMDGIGILTGDSDLFTSYKVTVRSKDRSTEYSYRDKSGETHRIDRAVHDAAVRQLRASNRMVTTESADYSAAHVLDRPLTRADVVSSEPLTRYFVTLEIRNRSFTLDLAKHARNATTAHTIDVEVPMAAYENGDAAFQQNWNVPGVLINGMLSKLDGNIVNRRTEVDRDFAQVKLADGRTIVMSQADLSALR